MKQNRALPIVTANHGIAIPPVGLAAVNLTWMKPLYPIHDVSMRIN